MTPTVRILLAEARRRLAAAPFEAPPREARLLLAHVLGRREVDLLGGDGELVPAPAIARFGALLERRLLGEPVAYLTGEREFWGRSFHVDSRVLVPRPETEHLVEAALDLPLPPHPRFLDLGTGSGCLAASLACELPAAHGIAVDLSPAALAVARRNLERHGVLDRVRPVAADLGRALALSRFDLVVSNPPYLAPEEAPTLSPEVRDHEPGLALFAPDRGLATITRLLHEVGVALAPGAWLACEIGAGQLSAVLELAAGSALALERWLPDLAGIPRVVVLRRRAV